jgi:hypothetical protein
VEGSHRWSNSGDFNGQALCITKKSPFSFKRARVAQNAYNYSSVWVLHGEATTSGAWIMALAPFIRLKGGVHLTMTVVNGFQ